VKSFRQQPIASQFKRSALLVLEAIGFGNEEFRI